jgi:diacylglycerol kinase (ATP)
VGSKSFKGWIVKNRHKFASTLSSKLKNRLYSFKHAFAGFNALWKSEVNVRIHFILFAMAIGFGWFLTISSTEWLFVVLSAGLVLVSEAFNTAIEKVCNFVEPNAHPKMGKIKDISAAAVLIAAIAAGVIGVIIFVPKIWKLFII